MKSLFNLVLVILLSSCYAKTNQIELVWKIQPGEEVKYLSIASEIEPLDQFKLDGLEVLKNSDLQEKVNNKLKSYEAPAPTLEALLIGSENGFNARFVAIKPDFNTAPTSEEEKAKRAFLEDRAGTVELLADLDSKGKLQSFYLAQKQKNILALFFQLPDTKLEKGAQWKLPVTFIQIGQGFVPLEAVRDQRAELLDVSKNQHGESIAEVSYVMAEKVSGQFEYTSSDQVVPVSSSNSYFANGLFNVDKGRWESLKVISYVKGSGLSVNENMMVFMLNPLDPIATR